MLRRLIILLPALLGTAAALADGPVTVATTSGEPASAATAAAGQAPAGTPTAKTARREAQAPPATAASQPPQPGGDVKMSGMSILGNEDAPKSLVLVPWKSSQLGDLPSVSRLLDASKQPVDKEVFLRELSYYEFRTDTK